MSDLPTSTCAFVLHDLPVSEKRVFRSLVAPRVYSLPLVALSVLGAGDLASGLATSLLGRSGWMLPGKQLRVAGQGRALPPCKLSVAATEAGTWSRQNLRDRCGSCGASPAILPRALRCFAGSSQKRPKSSLGPSATGATGVSRLQVKASVSSLGWPPVESTPAENNSVPFPGPAPTTTPKRPQTRAKRGWPG